MEKEKTNTLEPLEGNRPRALVIADVRVRFFLKLKRRDNTCNGNGYGIWSLDWAWLKKRGIERLWKQTLGNGDNGDRCTG